MACQKDQQKSFINKAHDYVKDSGPLLAQGQQPRIMCPLNEKGRCQLYGHRLMICRMHGVPNSFVRPDSKVLSFPGCIRCQDLYSNLDKAPMIDRTPFYKELASLELAFLKAKGYAVPKVRLTLAEMLIQGPPKI